MAPETRDKTKPEAGNPGGAVAWWFAVALFGYLGLLAALGAPYIFSRPLETGDICQQDIVATTTTTIVDEKATSLAREQARNSVLPVFKRNPDLDKTMLDRLTKAMDQVALLQREVGLPMSDAVALGPVEQAYVLECPDEAWTRVKSRAGLAAPAKDGQGTVPAQATTGVLPGAEDAIIKRLQGQATELPPSTARLRHSPRNASRPASLSGNEMLGGLERARTAYRKLSLPYSTNSHDLLILAASVPQDEMPAVSKTLVNTMTRMLKIGPLFPDTPRSDWERTVIELLPEKWNEKIRLTAARVVAAALEPNVVIDAEATRAKTETGVSRVAPVMREVRIGETIITRGSVVTPEAIAILKALGLTTSSNWPMVVSLALSLVAAFALVGVFLFTYEPKHLFSPSSIGLMSTVTVVTCAIAAFAGDDYPQFIPVPAATLVLAIFFGSRVSLILTVLLMIFLAVDNLLSPAHLIALGTAACAALGVNIKQRRDLMLRGFLIGILQSLGFLVAVILTQSAVSAPSLWRELTLHFLGGLSSCIVAIGSLPFLENLFGMVTPFRLSELTDSSQPLLRRLEENAPGTYQHSLAVANLAEAGARAIGGDVNLVRAGALYHDIGKMVRPRYFIENQLGDKNPHDAISPEESRDRVLAHVTDGLSLSRKYDLPKAVQDFIPQHQGTTLMAYFYHKACVRDGAENVDASFFRYPGPKPQSKEAAIVMLADVSEAVTHSMKDPSQEEIEAAMATVFKARWDDEQFTEAGITWNELERVKKAFVRVWRTLHHERLKYPSTTTGKMAVVPDAPSRPQTPLAGQPQDFTPSKPDTSV